MTRDNLNLLDEGSSHSQPREQELQMPKSPPQSQTHAVATNDRDLKTLQNAIEGARRCRWLTVSEIMKLLTPWPTMLLPLATEPPKAPPPSGTLLMYDRVKTRDYKRDGYPWIKKQKTNKVREDHVKLRFDGGYRVGGSYVHCTTRTSTHRRSYHLIDQPELQLDGTHAVKKKERGDPSYVLVHYLDTVESVFCMARRQEQQAHEHQRLIQCLSHPPTHGVLYGSGRRQSHQQLQHQHSVGTESMMACRPHSPSHHHNQYQYHHEEAQIRQRQHIASSSDYYNNQDNTNSNRNHNQADEDMLNPICFRSHNVVPSCDSNALRLLCSMIREEDRQDRRYAHSNSNNNISSHIAEMVESQNANLMPTPSSPQHTFCLADGYNMHDGAMSGVQDISSASHSGNANRASYASPGRGYHQYVTTMRSRQDRHIGVYQQREDGERGSSNIESNHRHLRSHLLDVDQAHPHPVASSICMPSLQPAARSSLKDQHDQKAYIAHQLQGSESYEGHRQDNSVGSDFDETLAHLAQNALHPKCPPNVAPGTISHDCQPYHAHSDHQPYSASVLNRSQDEEARKPESQAHVRATVDEFRSESRGKAYLMPTPAKVQPQRLSRHVDTPIEEESMKALAAEAESEDPLIEILLKDLPELVDFTPSDATLGSGTPIKVVFSISSPVDASKKLVKNDYDLSEDNIWKFFAAFVFRGKIENEPIGEICLSPLKQLTPYTFKCENILVALSRSGTCTVVLFKAHVNCDPFDSKTDSLLSSKVKIFLQSVHDVLETASSSNSDGSIALLSQFSEDCFQVSPALLVSVPSVVLATITNCAAFSSQHKTHVIRSRHTRDRSSLALTQLVIPAGTPSNRNQYMLARVHAPGTALPDTADSLIKFEIPAPSPPAGGAEQMDTCEESDGSSQSDGRRKRILASHHEDSMFGPKINKAPRSSPYVGGPPL
jgi:hypothetical protein